MANRRLLGDAGFYKKVLLIAVPIMIQNGITNFVALLDNIMVGQLGTEQMSGTAIVNQLLFVFSLTLFGSISGAGIFGAQYFGQGNSSGVRDTFRFKLATGIVVLAAGGVILSLFGTELISSYLTGNGESGNKALILSSGQDYLRIMLVGLIPFVITQVYASTLRETDQTFPPMFAGLAAVLINLALDWVLIFGHFGLPAMGVKGAALATVIARFAECGGVVIWTHRNSAKNEFIRGAYRTIAVPGVLVKKIVISGLPLMINECLWSAGMAVLNRCYSMRGVDVVAATNISSTIFNLFAVIFIALGNSVGIIVGQILGSGDMEKAKETDTRLIIFTVAAGTLTGGLMAVLSGVFPMFYNTTDEIRELAGSLITISGMFMPFAAFMHAAYFTLRSGGRTFITFLFDSAYVWAVTIPTALLLIHFTNLDIIAVYFLCQLVDIIKMTIGFILIKKGVWLRNIVASENIQKG
ncbi:MAG: MATE family efflux transporter [Oscillospiraceae bacterium]|nr:MATE family efflux transporter [Oscillospiraceae bacterium]